VGRRRRRLLPGSGKVLRRVQRDRRERDLLHRPQGRGGPVRERGEDPGGAEEAPRVVQRGGEGARAPDRFGPGARPPLEIRRKPPGVLGRVRQAARRRWGRTPTASAGRSTSTWPPSGASSAVTPTSSPPSEEWATRSRNPCLPSAGTVDSGSRKG